MGRYSIEISQNKIQGLFKPSLFCIRKLLLFNAIKLRSCNVSIKSHTIGRIKIFYISCIMKWKYSHSRFMTLARVKMQRLIFFQWKEVKISKFITPNNDDKKCDQLLNVENIWQPFNFLVPRIPTDTKYKSLVVSENDNFYHRRTEEIQPTYFQVRKKF